jgi:hypothetical protein
MTTLRPLIQQPLLPPPLQALLLLKPLKRIRNNPAFLE